tara:strand:+ start:187 stop:573 length:387 start_codon:yes stop_codon:yes gene_type:complete
MTEQTAKEQIVSALRSGEYKQTRSQLKEGDCFCILGVVCDVYMKERGYEWGTLISAGNEVSYPEKLSESNEEHAYQLLPPEIAEWAFGDRGEVSPRVWVDGKLRSLAYLNDGSDWTFKQFADLLEEQL